MAKALRDLQQLEVTVLAGVGPERAKALGELGVGTVLDLLTHFPRRYIDKTKQTAIGELKVDEHTWVFGRVVSSSSVPGRGRGKARTELRITDGSGFLRITFFNQPWRTRQFPEGSEAMFFGKVTAFKGQKQMSNPEIDLLDEADRLQVAAIYPQSDKLKVYSRDFRRWTAEALRRTVDFLDPVPEAVLDRFDLVDRAAAFSGIHRPESIEETAVARKRLVFDELLRIQLALVLRKQAYERTAGGIRHDTAAGRWGELVDRFVDRLPFDLTDGQHEAIDEIAADLAGPHPMHRLLQGDVGVGKTVVAVAAMLAAVQGGHQAAIMAPTEVLADQHGHGIRRLLDGFTVPGGADAGMLFDERPLAVELLTNRTTAKERERIAAGLDDGTVDVLVGTHALIEEGVRFRSLGVVVVDEQHRFGVEQRAALRAKGADGSVPDVLVMTATPIPRTAAMTVYGDLDVTTIRQPPAGRQQIETSWERTGRTDGQAGLPPLDALSVWGHVRDEVAAGHQAYVVCPLVEESEKLEVRSAEATFAELDAGPLAGLRLGLLHGRMKSAEKEAVMDAFRAGELDVLVATTVIEVGVDVPNATVMVVLDADRFGIAQLHQLRGRVGRGADRSRCFLVGAGATPDAERRLEAMVATTDGFELAEVDLEIRGEGTVFDTRQKGRNDLKLASLLRDRRVVVEAREVAFELVGADPGLAGHPDLLDEVELFLDEEDREFLERS
jgi:ATP-dependent DNA helicase RecG